MKKSALFIASLLFIAPIVHSDPPMSAETQAITRDAMLATKKALIAQNLNLTPTEEKTFWPWYTDYQIGLNKQTDQAMALVQKFAINFDSLTDDLATQLTNDYLKTQKDRLSYRRDGITKLQAMIAPKKVARFLQIENKLDATAMYQLTQQVPLAKNN